MRVAEETDTVRAVNGSSRKPVEVIEFQGACLAAPTAMLVSETAMAAVALEDLAFDGVRNVPRGRGARVAGRSRSDGRRTACRADRSGRVARPRHRLSLSPGLRPRRG